MEIEGWGTAESVLPPQYSNSSAPVYQALTNNYQENIRLSLGFDSFGSHGCVRLTESDAKALFEWTPLHTLVEVVAH